MQTSQVSNPANLFAAAKTAAKPAQADGADSGSFGQTLSREVAGREAGETPAAQAGQAQQAAADKPVESRAAKSGEAEDDAPAQDAAAPTDAQSQFSADMLALVAAINSITAPAARVTADTGETAAGLAADTGAGRGAAGLLAAIEPRAVTPAAASGETPVPTGDNANADAPGLPPVHADAALATMGTEAGDAVEAAPEFITALQESAASLSAAPAAPQLALQAARHNPAAAADRLTPAVGTPAWDQALGQKVVWMVAGDQQSASLTLNPPDLGPLQVVLNVSNSQASATFTAAQPEVRQALEAALPKLRDMLGEAGIQLGQASVNSGQPNQTGDDRRQAAQSHGRGGAGSDGGEEAQVRVTRIQPSASGLGLVDTFA